MLGLIRRLGIRSTFRAVRDTIRGGGPAGFRVAEVHPPEGFFVPTVTVDIEIPTRNGSVAELSPGLPLLSPLAWGYRVGKIGAMVRDRF